MWACYIGNIQAQNWSKPQALRKKDQLSLHKHSAIVRLQSRHTQDVLVREHHIGEIRYLRTQLG